MIELLQRNHHHVRKDALLKDWERVKSDYLTGATRDNPESEETEQMQKAMEIMSRYRGALAALAKQKPRIE